MPGSYQGIHGSLQHKDSTNGSSAYETFWKGKCFWPNSTLFAHCAHLSHPMPPHDIKPMGHLHCSVIDSDDAEAFVRNGNSFGKNFGGQHLSYRDFGTYEIGMFSMMEHCSCHFSLTQSCSLVVSSTPRSDLGIDRRRR